MSSSSDHIMDDKIAHTPTSHPLDRQITLQLNADQYERLFFQPSAAKSDLHKHFGNPTLLGVLGFLIPFSCTVFSLLQFQGSSPSSLVSISGSFYFFGGIAMTLAGIAEFILGNTFPFVVFIVYGCHWLNHGYISDPAHGLAASYGADGALNQAYNAGQGHYFLVMAMMSFVFLLGSLRTNVPFVVVFFGLMMVFSFIAAGSYQLGSNPTQGGLDHTFYYFKIAGVFGFITMMAGWYLAIITVCASTEIPCPLPIFDLSQKVFPREKTTPKPEDVVDMRSGV